MTSTARSGVCRSGGQERFKAKPYMQLDISCVWRGSKSGIRDLSMSAGPDGDMCRHTRGLTKAGEETRLDRSARLTKNW